MFKSILTATINSQTANNGLFLPLSFSYDDARVLGVLSVNKADAEKLMTLVNTEFGKVSGDAEESVVASKTTPSDEEFYQKMQVLVSDKNRFHFPMELTLVVMRSGGEILILNWGGSVLLRRHGKIGQLTSVGGDKAELEVKAGKLKKGDLLALFNSNATVVLERIRENLETAKDWTDFVLYSQAYLTQPNLENLGLLVLKIKSEEAAETVKTEPMMVEEGEKDSNEDESSDDEAEDKGKKKMGVFGSGLAAVKSKLMKGLNDKSEEELELEEEVGLHDEAELAAAERQAAMMEMREMRENVEMENAALERSNQEEDREVRETGPSEEARRLQAELEDLQRRKAELESQMRQDVSEMEKDPREPQNQFGVSGARRIPVNDRHLDEMRSEMSRRFEADVVSDREVEDEGWMSSMQENWEQRVQQRKKKTGAWEKLGGLFKKKT